MNKNWQTKKILELGTVVTGKTPSTNHLEYYGGDFPFITPVELHGGYNVTTSQKTLTSAGMEAIKSNTISGNSVLVGCIGWDLGNVAFCNRHGATNQQINAITNISDEINPYYLYYWLSTKKQYLFSIASITRTPILSKSVFEEITIPLPRRDMQDRISDWLLRIDKLIDLNNQINDNLAKAASEAYMHLFFGRRENAKLSDILIEHPKSEVQVGEAKNIDGGYPFFTSGDSVLRWTSYMVDDRCILLNTGGNVGVKFYVGKLAHSTDTWCISGKEGYSDYLFLLLSSIRKELDQKFFSGTGLKHLQKPLLRDRPIYKPTEDELERFNKLAVPAMTTISAIVRENHLLTELRDWLLPMLMNGQATVRSTPPNYRLSARWTGMASC